MNNKLKYNDDFENIIKKVDINPNDTLKNKILELCFLE